MSEQIQQLFLQIVVPAAFTAIAALVTWGGKRLIALIDTKTKNEAVAGILARLTAAVQTVVLDVNGTLKAEYVKASADGVLTDKEKAHLREIAVAKIKEHLGANGLKSLITILGINGSLIDTFIGSHIEAAVEGMKADPAPIIVAASPAAPAAPTANP